jgi:uncharacterized protein (TIGR03437 family)
MLVAIYGADLANGTAQATGTTFPLQLADAQVLVGGSPIPLYYVSPAQINAVLPESASGLVTLTVQNGAGKHTVNIFVEAAAPALFTEGSSGTGPAAALKAADQSPVTAANPLHAGDAVELFGTGLGLTAASHGLEVAVQQPTVTFAGAAPNYIGLDQINCTIPAGISSLSAPIVVTSGARTSNAATLAVE